MTTNGPLSSQPYFIRLSKTGDPNAAISYNVGNGGPTLDQRAVIDAGFLELVRLGELSATDPDVANSLTVVDETIEKQTASGPAGCATTATATATATSRRTTLPDRGYAVGAGEQGHRAPVAGAVRRTRRSRIWPPARPTLGGPAARGDERDVVGVGLVPEQVWDAPNVAASPFGTDPTIASIGFANGKPDGSAGAAHLGCRLAGAADGRPERRPSSGAAGADRRPLHHPHPAGDHAHGDVAARPDAGHQPHSRRWHGGARCDRRCGRCRYEHDDATPAAKGCRRRIVQLRHRPARRQQRAGGHQHRVRTAVPPRPFGRWSTTSWRARCSSTATDPTGDDNGPGNYAYPTAGDFHAGAYDLTDFQVYDTGITVTFRVQTRDLTPTFGSPLGAQLVDVYVHQPGCVAYLDGGVVPDAQLHDRRRRAPGAG